MLLLEMTIILLLVLLNGFFASAEMAVVSARRARIQGLAREGDRKAEQALQLLDHPNTFLASVQVGITLIGTLASAFGGARVAQGVQAYLDVIPWLRPYSAPLSLGLVVLFITYLSLVLGELAPKRIALRDPEAHTRRIAGFFLVLSRLAAPVIRFLTQSSKLVATLVAGEERDEPSITEEEIEATLEAGVQGGVLELVEQEFLQAVMRLSDTEVRMIMVPRTDIVGVEAGQPARAVMKQVVDSGVSRMPVYEGDLDHILGLLQVRDLLGLEEDALDQDIALLARPPVFTTETMPAFRLLEIFKRAGARMAIVLDEYGGTAGLVTLADVLEEIVGDLGDEYELMPEPQMRRLAAGVWSVDGRLASERLKDALGLRDLAGEQEYRFETVAGFVLAQLGDIPEVGDAFVEHDYRFEVLRMEGQRVATVRVTRVKHSDGDEAGQKDRR